MACLPWPQARCVTILCHPVAKGSRRMHSAYAQYTIASPIECLYAHKCYLMCIWECACHISMTNREGITVIMGSKQCWRLSCTSPGYGTVTSAAAATTLLHGRCPLQFSGYHTSDWQVPMGCTLEYKQNATCQSAADLLLKAEGVGHCRASAQRLAW